MIDLHTHTVFSDGELIPAELIRRAEVLGTRAIAITDHCDFTNVDHIVSSLKRAKTMCEGRDIDVFAGVELTHVPPEKIARLADMARKAGAEVIVVHGESPVEPVLPDTNRMAVEADIDILAHPGFITEDIAQVAKDSGIMLELTSRGGHNRTNGHVAKTALAVGAQLVVDTDSHAPHDLIDRDTALLIAIGAGLSQRQADTVLDNSRRFIESIL